MIARTLAEINRSTRARPRPFTVREFLPFNLPGEEAKRSGGGRISTMEAFIAWAKGIQARQEAMKRPRG